MNMLRYGNIKFTAAINDRLNMKILKTPNIDHVITRYWYIKSPRNALTIDKNKQLKVIQYILVLFSFRQATHELSVRKNKKNQKDNAVDTAAPVAPYSGTNK